jgi:hypothetical protein
MFRCLLRVLCPVRRPVTTLDYVLLKDNNLAFVAGVEPDAGRIMAEYIKEFGEKLVPLPLGPPLTPHGLAFCRNRVSALIGQLKHP